MLVLQPAGLWGVALDALTPFQHVAFRVEHIDFAVALVPLLGVAATDTGVGFYIS